MLDNRDDIRRAGLVALAVGTTIGAAAAVALGIRARLRGRRSEALETSPELLQLETAVVDALVADDVAGRLPIEVEAIAPGIIEVTGRVETEDEADRAVAVAQRVAEVRTVLNRMDVGRVSEQTERARQRQAGGESRESHWYGVGVGTGRRRQSRETDPARPDDSIHMRTEQFEAERHGESFEAPHREPGAEDPQPPL
jgi:hypothetical protein